MRLLEGGWISRFRECKWSGKRFSYFLIIFFLFGLLVNSIVLMTLQVQSKRIIAESNRDEIIINLTDKIDGLISYLHSPPKNGTLAPTTTTTTTPSQNFTSAQTEKSTLPNEEGTSILTTHENPNLTTQYSYSTSTTEQTNEETFPVSQNATIPSFTTELSTSETEPDTTSTTKAESILTSTLSDTNTNSMTTFTSETTDTSTNFITSSFISTVDFTNPDFSTLSNSEIPTSTIQNPEDDSSPFTNAHTSKTSEDLISTEMEMNVTNIFSITTEYVTDPTTNYSLPDETTYYTYTTQTVTDTTTSSITASTSSISSTPGQPKKRPYLKLKDMHRSFKITDICVRYCQNPPIIKSNLTIQTDIAGNTAFFEAYVSGSSFQPLPALEKVSYFALEELYPLSIDDVEIPEDLSHATPECSITPTDIAVKCTKK